MQQFCFSPSPRTKRSKKKKKKKKYPTENLSPQIELPLIDKLEREKGAKVENNPVEKIKI